MSDLDDLRARYPGAVTFRFGDGPTLSARLVALVRAGRKTATCGARRDFGEDGEPLPLAGRRDIVLNWDGTPALVIETLSVATCRFDEITEDFALSEGEDDDYAGWHDSHAAYFRRNGGWSPNMMMVCERFRLVEDLGP